jgi:hypothetical protein
MGVPQNYDVVKLSISPTDLYNTFQKVKAILDDVSTQLDNIGNTFQGLELSWTGSSSSLAQEYNDRINAATDALFGTTKNPGKGVFNRVLAGMLGASQNYDQTEQWVASALNQFANPSAAKDAGGAAGQPGQTPTFETTAIVETWPFKVYTT